MLEERGLGCGVGSILPDAAFSGGNSSRTRLAGNSDDRWRIVTISNGFSYGPDSTAYCRPWAQSGSPQALHAISRSQNAEIELITPPNKISPCGFVDSGSKLVNVELAGRKLRSEAL